MNIKVLGMLIFSVVLVSGCKQEVVSEVPQVSDETMLRKE